MSKQEFYILFLIVSVISILFHLKSFYVKHNEGDEIVFRTLAKEMNWDLSHYTTMDNKYVRQFPSKIYTQPLFFHPPFYPLILKLGQFLGNSVLWGLLFQNVSFILLMGFMCRVLFVLKLSRSAVVMALALLVLCPVHLFSTTKLHLDGLLSIYFFCGVTLFVESLIKKSLLKSFLSGILLTVALNMKYTVLAMTPILFFVQVYYLYTKIDHGKNYQQTIFNWKNWKYFLIMGIPVLLLGGQHFVRFFLEYGTLNPARFTTTMEEAFAWNRFLATIHSRTRLHCLSYLLAIFPIFAIYLTPPFWIYCKNNFKTKEWGFIYVAISIYLIIICFYASYKQLRYLAPILPFTYLTILLVWEKVSPRIQKYYSGLILLSLFLMSTTGFRNTILFPLSDKIVPSIFDYLPFLQKYYL